MAEAKIKLKGKYLTKSGNQVECTAVQGEVAECVYIKIGCVGQEGLAGRKSEWLLDGKWKKYPGGIHDITGEVK